MTVRAIVLVPGEPVAIKEIANDLQSLQAAIGGGFVERVSVTADSFMLIDEDGKDKNLTMNPIASVLMWALVQYPIARSDFIAGTAIILGSKGTEIADFPQSAFDLVKHAETIVKEN
jgi:hypothetical protein